MVDLERCGRSFLCGFSAYFLRKNRIFLLLMSRTPVTLVMRGSSKNISIADDLRGRFLDRVLCHELCHAFCLSYNVYMDIDTEEIAADFLTTYGREVFEIADRLLIELMEVA